MSPKVPGFPYFLLVRAPLFFLLLGIGVYLLGQTNRSLDPVSEFVLAPVALTGLLLGIGQFFVVPIAIYRAKRAHALSRIEVQLAICCGCGYYFVTASLHAYH